MHNMGISDYAQLSYPIALLNARNEARTMILVTCMDNLWHKTTDDPPLYSSLASEVSQSQVIRP